MRAERITADPGFAPLLCTQALTALHHNLLRSAVLTMIAFGAIDTGAWPVESVVGATTILAVVPYVVLSLSAGRWTDRWSRAGVIRLCKLAEVAIAGIAAVGLLSGNLAMLLAAVLVCGVEAAVLGPAKFAILPELVAAKRLVAANSWVTATSTIAILLGLVLGNVLAAISSGPGLLSILGVTLALAGVGLSRAIPDAEAPQAGLASSAWSDAARILTEVARQPPVLLAILGCSWFWFQGAFNTTAIPLLIAAMGEGEVAVSIVFLVSSICVAAGAMVARLVQGKLSHPAVPAAVALMTVLPATDIGFLSAAHSYSRLLIDIALMSTASGLYIVPVGLAMQVLPPAADRGRYIGINHVFNGLAMLLAGACVAGLGVLSMRPDSAIGSIGVMSACVAIITLPTLLPSLTAFRTRSATADLAA